MNKIIEYILGIIVITCTNIYLWSKLLGKRPNFKCLKTYIIFILMMIVTLINYFYNSGFIKILTITMIMTIFIKFLFKQNINNSLLISVTSQIIYMISETIFLVIIASIFNETANEIIINQFGTFTTNLIISIFCIIIINIPITKKFYKYLTKITDKLNSNILTIFLAIIIFLANLLSIIVYYKLSFSYLLIFNTTLTLFCLSIVLYSFFTKNKYIKIYDKYNTTLNSLKEYEDILDKYRILNHENKNQLLTIRNMTPTKDKNIRNYIDTIIEDKIKDNEKIMFKTSKIPAGGLRGLIYSKILLMDKYNINYNLEISNKVRTVDLINKIDDNTILDICKIIGVYLDNSIQAVENLDNKNINIQMYLEDKDLIISISNNYTGNIDLYLIEKSGYTSKGEGHGYGLTLVKELIESNSKLINEKRILNDFFYQILKIKM